MGLNKTLLASVIANAFSFNAVNLFASGEQGVLYDLSNVSTIYQDSAGTTPVAASGDPIGKIMDLSGHGYNLLQPTAGKRPTYNITSGLKSARFNGSSSSMMAAGVDMSTSTKCTIVVGITQNSGAASQMIAESGTGTPGGGFCAILNNTATGSVGGGLGSGGGAYVFPNGPESTTPRVMVVTFEYDPLAATYATQVAIRVGGVSVDETNAASAGTLTTAAFALRDLYFGARQNATLFLDADIYFFAMVGRALTATERQNLERLAASRSGAPIFNQIIPTQFNDTGAVVSQSGYLQTSAYSSVTFSTAASIVELDIFNNLYTDFPDFTNIAVFIDGVYSQTISPGVLGPVTRRILPPAGNNTITLVNGLQSRLGGVGTVLGTWLTKVRANAPLSQGTVTPTNRILIYGDSIAVGGNATATQTDAWPMLLRGAYAPNSVALEAWGQRSLYEDCVDASARAAFVAKIVAYAPAKIWLAIGTNDYGENKWSAASFGAAYAALLDDLHTALPSVLIYAQTLLLRANETVNTFGSTTGDYRTQIATAQSTRYSYCALVDGTAIMTTASLVDGVHPTSAGHALYATAVRSVLGI